MGEAACANERARCSRFGLFTLRNNSVATARCHESRVIKRRREGKRKEENTANPWEVQRWINRDSIEHWSESGSTFEVRCPPSLLGRYFGPFNIVISEPTDMIDPDKAKYPAFLRFVTSLCESGKGSSTNRNPETPIRSLFPSGTCFFSARVMPGNKTKQTRLRRVALPSQAS